MSTGVVGPHGEAVVPCPACGMWMLDIAGTECPRCKQVLGAAVQNLARCPGDSQHKHMAKGADSCPACHGSGYVPALPEGD
jgi:hypothetical protein